MKKITILLCTLFLSAPLLMHAQGTVNALENDYGARVAVGLNKKLVKGVHVKLDFEGRMSDNFSNFGRYDVGAGMTFKVGSMFKLGFGYIFISKKNSSDVWKPRHRVYGDAAMTFKTGVWNFQVKERLQLTHRDVGNYCQTTPNSLSLKSRFKISYKGLANVTPYGYIELRNVFNDPSCSATWSTTSLAYSDYEFAGYTDMYINRVRGALGLEWKLNKQNALEFSVLTDYCYDKNIDVNSSYTKLKSLTYDQALNVSACVGYTFSF